MKRATAACSGRSNNTLNALAVPAEMMDVFETVILCIGQQVCSRLRTGSEDWIQ